MTAPRTTSATPVSHVFPGAKSQPDSAVRKWVIEQLAAYRKPAAALRIGSSWGLFPKSHTQQVPETPQDDREVAAFRAAAMRYLAQATASPAAADEAMASVLPPLLVQHPDGSVGPVFGPRKPQDGAATSTPPQVAAETTPPVAPVRAAYAPSRCQTPCRTHPDCVCAVHEALEGRLRGIEERLAALEADGLSGRGA